MSLLSASIIALASYVLAAKISFAIEVEENNACQASSSPTGLPLRFMLNNGNTVPRIGFGTAGLGGTTESAVSLALEVGYRHFDTAQAWEWYRENDVGQALEKAGIDWDGKESNGKGRQEKVSRGDIHVTTKLHPRDHGREQARKRVEESRLNLGGVELLLLHSPRCWPGSCPESSKPWQEAWKALEELYAEGKVGAIGVSNFDADLLLELLDMAEIPPAMVQNWMDPFHQDRAVRELCFKRGIAYTAYSTLGGQWTYRTSPPGPNPISSSPTLQTIADAHQGASVQSVVLSWALQEGAIIIPRSTNASHAAENLHMFLGRRDSEGGEGQGGLGSTVKVFLTGEDMEAIRAMDGTLG